MTTHIHPLGLLLRRGSSVVLPTRASAPAASEIGCCRYRHHRAPFPNRRRIPCECAPRATSTRLTEGEKTACHPVEKQGCTIEIVQGRNYGQLLLIYKIEQADLETRETGYDAPPENRRTVGISMAAAGVRRHTAPVPIRTQSLPIAFAKGVISARPAGASP